MLKPIPKRKPWRSKAYLEHVRGMPCCVSGLPDADPHHYQREGEGTMGGKVCDSRCVPLHPRLHRLLHDTGRDLWQEWRVCPEEVIQRVQAAWVAKGGARGWEGE